ncbi:type II secretion system F family protein [Helicobacter sp. 11S02596-1]|uniref:type II secretion system F family protein n=1 Tax=Helicobacter sp. 11S02596-1 TaxID=1476194 RepID=UPI000BA75FC8|nr:type II secretion system F family protein [Helicobacter sp. 11S02596-1]PAF43632.1 hypothetical protein BJI48_05090 [Helicobacter sp. 11S02596-1]
MYALFLLFGVVVLALAIRQQKILKDIARRVSETPSISKELHIGANKNTKTQEILERSDGLLRAIRKFDESISRKILSAMGIFLCVFFIKTLFGWQISQSMLGVIGILAIIACFLLPSYLQKFIVASRVEKINKDIPMFVDLLGICVQSGMNIERAIAFLDENVSQINKGFAPFLKQIVLKSQINGLESAIDDLQKDLPSTQVSMMCITLKQSLRYGSAVYETLMGLSMEIREFELLKTEEAIGKLSAKMSIPLILFFMFPVIIIIAAPGVMKVMEGF